MILRLVYRLFKKVGFANYFNFVFKIKYLNSNILIPVFSDLGFDNLDTSEKWMGQLLKHLNLPKNHTFVDVGVNVGQTLIKYKTAYPAGNYLGFEPNATCIHYVNKLIDLNSFTNVELYPIGLSDENQIINLQFYGDSATDPSASAVKNFRPSSKVFKTINIPVLKPELIDFESRKISLIKIDVEGMENKVLVGLKDILFEHHPIIIMEILPIYDKKNTDRIALTREIEDIMLSLHGYLMYEIVKSVNNEFVELKVLEKIPIHSDLTKCDYLFQLK